MDLNGLKISGRKGVYNPTFDSFTYGADEGRMRDVEGCVDDPRVTRRDPGPFSDMRVRMREDFFAEPLKNPCGCSNRGLEFL